jgi:hypothetical protein
MISLRAWGEETKGGKMMLKRTSYIKQVFSHHTTIFPHSTDGKDALQMWKQLQTEYIK